MEVGELVVCVDEAVPGQREQNHADGHQLFARQFLRAPVDLLRGDLVEGTLMKTPFRKCLYLLPCAHFLILRV